MGQLNGGEIPSQVRYLRQMFHNYDRVFAFALVYLYAATRGIPCVESRR